jgi:hypothetical protein
MAAKRLTRKLIDVIAEVESQLRAHYGVTQRELDAWRARAKALSYRFPISYMIQIEDLWIDYEVQRDVIHKHIINIMRKWDPRICSPGSACRLIGKDNIYLYDAQHRTIAAGILGFTEIPCAVVETEDPNFASYAFEMLNEKGVKRLTPGDLHRNALVRYKNGSRERVNLLAFNMQMAFDTSDVDLEDKNTRNNPNLRGSSDYFFSHFKYAQKAVELDGTGMLLRQMLEAITGVYKLGSEVDQGVFIGLYELQRMASVSGYSLPNGWMKQVLTLIKQRFNSSNLVHDRAKLQFFHKFPGATWSAPSAMSEFMREIYMLEGGQIPLPTHGIGACLDVATNPAPGLFPVVVQSAHPTTMVAA